jgi:hypothetical protein
MERLGGAAPRILELDIVLGRFWSESGEVLDDSEAVGPATLSPDKLLDLVMGGATVSILPWSAFATIDGRLGGPLEDAWKPRQGDADYDDGKTLEFPVYGSHRPT